MRSHSEGNAVGMLTINHKPLTNIKEAKSKKAAASPLDFFDSEKIVVDDFVKQRKTKLTQTALNGIKKEAEKAGVSMNDALSLACVRGWQSFKAEWLKPAESKFGQSQPSQAAVDACAAKEIARTQEMLKGYEGGKRSRPSSMPSLGSLLKPKEMQID